MNSEQCLESNHGFRTYLYYVCWIFSFCQGHSVEQWPTLKIQKFKTKETKPGARRDQRRGDACLIHSLQLSNRRHTGLSWIRRGLCMEALQAAQFESPQGRFCILFFKTCIF